MFSILLYISLPLFWLLRLAEMATAHCLCRKGKVQWRLVVLAAAEWAAVVAAALAIDIFAHAAMVATWCLACRVLLTIAQAIKARKYVPPLATSVLLAPIISVMMHDMTHQFGPPMVVLYAAVGIGYAMVCRRLSYSRL